MSIGEALASARRRTGLTIAQVSERTRIRQTIILGIERDDYSACGGDFYARGHIRSIARVVGADPEPLIWEFDSARPAQEPITAARAFEPQTPVNWAPPVGGGQPRRRGWAVALGVALAAVAALVAYFLLSGSHGARHPRPGAAQATSNGARPRPQATAASPYAHNTVIRLTARSGCRVGFSTPAGLLLTRSSVAAGESKAWTFHRAVTMMISSAAAARLTVDGENPLPARPGAGPVTLRLGLNHAVSVVSHPAPTARALRPASVAAFGPGGKSAGDNAQLAALAIDHSLATAWHSDWYTTARFGGLQQGSGLLLDMGRPVAVTTARITLGSARAANLELRAGSAATLAGLRPVARAAGVAGQVSLRPHSPARARFVLIWFTKLPPSSTGTFRVSVYAVHLKGHA